VTVDIFVSLILRIILKTKIILNIFLGMNKSEGTLHIYTKKTGLVSDVFVPGNVKN